MNKLAPKIKFGCPKCGGIQLEDLDIPSNFNVKMPSKKVTSIVSTKPKKSSRVVSLF